MSESGFEDQNLKPPAFQFYVDDFLGGTLHFTDAEVGLYIRLLCVQWSAGSLPDNDEELASYGKNGVAIARVKAKFIKGTDGRLRNERLEAERTKQTDYRASQAISGRKGAEKRWGRYGDPTVSPMAENSSPSPSPSPSPDLAGREYAERPNLEEVKFQASTIGLGAWKAEDWFQEMEGGGWLDHEHRPVRNWKAMLSRVKTKWDSDGRPTSPPVNGRYQKPVSLIPEILPIREL